MTAVRMVQCGPKAHQQASPGQARNERRPGKMANTYSSSPNGANQIPVPLRGIGDGSVPNVALLDLDAVLAAQGAELILKRHFAMMLFLPRDILPDFSDVRLAHGERAIP